MGRIILFGSPTQTLPQGESFKYNEYYTPCCCAPLLLLVATRGLTVDFVLVKTSNISNLYHHATSRNNRLQP